MKVEKMFMTMMSGAAFAGSPLPSRDESPPLFEGFVQFATSGDKCHDDGICHPEYR